MHLDARKHEVLWYSCLIIVLIKDCGCTNRRRVFVHISELELSNDSNELDELLVTVKSIQCVCTR